MKPRLCCIEPSGALRLVLIEIARKAGWDIEACKNLAEAEEVFALQDKRLDLIATTATLETGGYRDVVKCLRSRHETATTPIVLFTGNGDEEQIELAMANGITEVFLKSSLGSFESYLYSFFNNSKLDLSGKRVLILEDEKSVGEYLRALLAEQQLQVDLFDHAAAALDEAFLTAYDLVLADLVLDQNQSGVNFIRQLRQSKGKSSTAPVIAISGYVDDARRIEALRAGADAFLAKPILTSELLFHARRLIGHIPAAEAIDPATSASVPPAIAAAQMAIQEWLVLASHVLHEIHQGVMVTDAKGVILVVNPGFTEITGYSSEEAIGNTPRLLKSGKHSAEFYRDMFATLEAKGSWSGKLWNRGKAGNLFVEWLDIRRLPPGMPMGAHYVAVIGDVTKQHNEIEDLRYSALHDPLTGLANRALLRDRAAQEIYRAQRNGTHLGIAFIDLDGFKPINDKLGHEVGDQVLRAIAQRLSGALRAHDTLARQGGDEFIALLSDLDDRHAIEILGRKLLDVFEAPIQIDTTADYPLRASIGISLYPDDGLHFEELVVRADMAMYRAKLAGGAQACSYDAALDSREAR